MTKFQEWNLVIAVLTTTLILHSQPAEDIFQETPLGDGGLQQVYSYKSCEPKPINVYING
jgi:hypothetical protein